MSLFWWQRNILSHEIVALAAVCRLLNWMVTLNSVFANNKKAEKFSNSMFDFSAETHSKTKRKAYQFTYNQQALLFLNR